jgi:uncharacterized protein with NRDE domain
VPTEFQNFWTIIKRVIAKMVSVGAGTWSGKTKLGCEAAIHTTRTFVNNDQNRGKVLLKLDFKNAFNSVEWDCILKEVQCHTPLLYPYLYRCYRITSTLFFDDH